MSTIKLNSENDVDPAQIESVTFEEKGAKISAKVVSVASGEEQDLRVPEDSLVVRLADGGEFVIRGSGAAQRAWEQLEAAKKQGGAAFTMTRNAAGK